MESSSSFIDNVPPRPEISKSSAFQNEEARYRLIFNSMPVGLWEQDFSDVKMALDELKAKGVTEFEAYFNQNPSAVVELAAKVKVFQINQAALKMYAASSPQELWDHLAYYLTPEAWQAFQQELIGIAEGKTKFSFDTTNYTLRHEIIHIHLDWIVLPGFEQTYERILVVTQDITNQKLAEKAIRDSEQRYRSLFEFMQEGFALHEILLDDQGKPCDYRFLEVNPAFEALTGLSRQQLIGRTVLEVLPDIEPYWIETYGNVALSGVPSTIANYSQALGKYYLVRAYSPAPRLFATLFNDITQMKLMEKELREKETWLEQALDAGRIGIWEWHVPSAQRMVDHRWTAMLGYSHEEAQQLDINHLESFVHPEDRLLFLAMLHDYRTGNISSHQLEYRLLTKTGDWKWVLSSGKVVERDAEGKPIRVLGVMMDIDQRKRAELDRVAAETRFKAIFNAAAEVIFVLDEHCIIQEANPAACTSLGFEKNELIGFPLCSFVLPEKTEWFRQELHTVNPEGKILPEIILLNKENEEVIFEANLVFYTIMYEPLILCVMRDITERKRIQETMMQTEKMAALGMMAAGVAHEINNPMQVITGVSQSLLSQIERGKYNPDELKRYLQMLERNAWRVVDIVKSLNIYAHIDDRQFEPLNLNEVLQETLQLFGPQLKKLTHIEVITEYEDNLPLIHGNEGQLGQVILNLLTNARDAIEDRGTIHIRTYTTQTSPADSIEQNRSPQPVVCLEISDSGKGIPKEIQNKIFDPFFTTKPVGVGTGLGLAIVLSILNYHGAKITLTSKQNHGTTFKVTFPPAAENQTSAHRKQISPE